VFLLLSWLAEFYLTSSLHSSEFVNLDPKYLNDLLSLISMLLFTNIILYLFNSFKLFIIINVLAQQSQGQLHRQHRKEIIRNHIKNSMRI